jgi:hypothetical protein
MALTMKRCAFLAHPIGLRFYPSYRAQLLNNVFFEQAKKRAVVFRPWVFL